MVRGNKSIETVNNVCGETSRIVNSYRNRDNTSDVINMGSVYGIEMRGGVHTDMW